jgi:hypothetical protein
MIAHPALAGMLPILVLAIAVLLYSFVMFDRLVKAEYTHARSAWEADGRPRGFFWHAPECTWLRSGWAVNRLGFIWLFKTPNWAAQSAHYRDWLKRFRICVLAWNITIVGLFVAFMLVVLK